MEAAQASETKAQKDSKMSAEEINAILVNEGSGSSPDDYDEANESEEVKTRRVDYAKAMLGVCQQLWQGGHPELDLVTEKLGDGSRDGKCFEKKQWTSSSDLI